MEWGTLLFSFYWKCNIDSVLVNLGKSMTSVAGFVNMAIVSGFTYLNEIGSQEWQNNVINLINEANIDGSDQAWMAVGTPVGELIANFFNYNVPNYDFQYG